MVSRPVAVSVAVWEGLLSADVVWKGVSTKVGGRFALRLSQDSPSLSESVRRCSFL